MKDMKCECNVDDTIRKHSPAHSFVFPMSVPRINEKLSMSLRCKN